MDSILFISFVLLHCITFRFYVFCQWWVTISHNRGLILYLCTPIYWLLWEIDNHHCCCVVWNTFLYTKSLSIFLSKYKIRQSDYAQIRIVTPNKKLPIGGPFSVYITKDRYALRVLVVNPDIYIHFSIPAVAKRKKKKLPKKVFFFDFRPPWRYFFYLSFFSRSDEMSVQTDYITAEEVIEIISKICTIIHTQLLSFFLLSFSRLAFLVSSSKLRLLWCRSHSLSGRSIANDFEC